MANSEGESVRDDAPVKSCVVCGHHMEIEEDVHANPQRHWRCICGHEEPLYGKTEEGEA